jgi:hypothetical protein
MRTAHPDGRDLPKQPRGHRGLGQHLHPVVHHHSTRVDQVEDPVGEPGALKPDSPQHRAGVYHPTEAPRVQRSRIVARGCTTVLGPIRTFLAATKAVG